MLISLILAILSIIPILLFSPGRFSPKDDNFIFFVSIVSIVNIIVYLYSTRKIYKNWLRADVFFLVGFIIVHFQIPLLSTFGIDPVRASYIWFNKQVVNFATEFSAYAILLWIIGAQFYFLKGKIFKKFSKKALKKGNYKINKNILFDFIFILSVLVWVGTVGSSFWGGSHAGVYNWGAGATYSFLIMRVMLTLSVIYLFINNKGKFRSLKTFFIVLYKNKLLFSISIFYCLIFTFVGDRGPVIQLLLTYMGCYVIYNKEISFKKMASYIILGAFAMTIIGLGRTSEASNREGNIFTVGYENLVNSKESVIPTEELASSNRILFLALDWVPNKHPFLNGLTVGSNLIGIIPFGSNIINVPPMYQSSTSFFTISEKGDDFKFGLGSEIIADLYINFGLEITLIIFLFFGYYLTKLTYYATYIKTHYVIIIYISVLVLALYMNRSIFLVPLKPMVYALVIDYIFTKKIYEN